MTKNETIVTWIAKPLYKKDRLKDGREQQYKSKLWDGYYPTLKTIKFDYNLLHEAWVKFRDLGRNNMPIEYHLHKKQIEQAILEGTITEAFDELVKGIEWYQNLNKEK